MLHVDNLTSLLVERATERDQKHGIGPLELTLSLPCSAYAWLCCSKVMGLGDWHTSKSDNLQSLCRAIPFCKSRAHGNGGAGAYAAESLTPRQVT